MVVLLHPKNYAKNKKMSVKIILPSTLKEKFGSREITIDNHDLPVDKFLNQLFDLYPDLKEEFMGEDENLLVQVLLAVNDNIIIRNNLSKTILKHGDIIRIFYGLSGG